MARHESDFHVNTGKSLSLDELLSLLCTQKAQGERTREDAIACYLSASEGWREALELLGGAFAEGPGGLNVRKDD